MKKLSNNVKFWMIFIPIWTAWCLFGFDRVFSNFGTSYHHLPRVLLNFSICFTLYMLLRWAFPKPENKAMSFGRVNKKDKL